MARKKSQAQRLRRKLRKREERRLRARRRQPWSEAVSEESKEEARRQEMLAEIAELMKEWYPPCSEAVAEDFTGDAGGVCEHLGELAAGGREALDQWPDAPETRELRSVLRDMVETAETGAQRWEALLRRFEALAQAESHAHLVDGHVVYAAHVSEDEDADSCRSGRADGHDDIPY